MRLTDWMVDAYIFGCGRVRYALNRRKHRCMHGALANKPCAQCEEWLQRVTGDLQQPISRGVE